MTDLESRTSELLQTCLAASKDDADRIAGALTDAERFRLDAALRYLRRASSPFDVFFFVEALVAAKEKWKCTFVQRLFRDHTSTDDKIELAVGWTFTDPYRFGSVRGSARHVMYPECLADTAWIHEHLGVPNDFGGAQDCTTGINGFCPCVQWLRDNPAHVDRALDAVIGHLCIMRHSLVHESWPVFMVVEEMPEATLGSTMLDCYPCDCDRNDPNLFRTYQTCISLGRFKAICVAAAQSHLNRKYP